MDFLGLTEVFEHVVISCDVGYMKPHPRIFHNALELMGVESEDAVLVGNSHRADVEGAKTLGMTTIWRRWAERRVGEEGGGRGRSGGGGSREREKAKGRT